MFLFFSSSSSATLFLPLLLKFFFFYFFFFLFFSSSSSFTSVFLPLLLKFSFFFFCCCESVFICGWEYILFHSGVCIISSEPMICLLLRDNYDIRRLIGGVKSQLSIFFCVIIMTFAGWLGALKVDYQSIFFCYCSRPDINYNNRHGWLGDKRNQLSIYLSATVLYYLPLSPVLR